MYHCLLCDISVIFYGGKQLNEAQSCPEAQNLLGRDEIVKQIYQIKIWCG